MVAPARSLTLRISASSKLLLLDGAVKPTGWTHSAMMPLDPSNGAGIVNIFNSYEILAAGDTRTNAFVHYR